MTCVWLKAWAIAGLALALSSPGYAATSTADIENALSGSGEDAAEPADRFIESLSRRVPEILLRYGAPSASVAVIRNGRTFARTWGVADLATGRLANNDTLYNVASISKLVTAWAVMRLVEEGRVDLDAPVSRYVHRWSPPRSRWNNQVTVRRLLSHSAGLSMPSVAQFSATDPLPAIEDTLRGEDPLRITQSPGLETQYSGGGFAVLQLLIEEVTGQRFEEYVQEVIFGPLGMHHSTFTVPASNRDDVATPYDVSLRPLPHYAFSAAGAAGLYTTIQDMARFAEASLPNPGRMAMPLRAETIRMMQIRTAVERGTGDYGLGYNITTLSNGVSSFGHAGSNDGWHAIFLTIPETGDALVVMINRSTAFSVYRDISCEWLRAVRNLSELPRSCDRATVAWTDEDTQFTDNLFAGTGSSDPAISILVSTDDGVVYRRSFGSRRIDSPVPAEPETPFYIASVTKSYTALTALRLAEEGIWRLSDRIGRYIPELPAYARDVTLEQLLSHTAGLPDYYRMITWGTPQVVNNAHVINLMSQRSQLEFPAGSRYAYSNTGYVLLGTAIERATNLEYGRALSRYLSTDTSVFVYRGSAEPPAERALGYGNDRERRHQLSDYRATAFDGRRYPVSFATYGAGGLYTNIDALNSLSRSLDSEQVLRLPSLLMAFAPRTPLGEEAEIPTTIGHGFGWFVSRRNDLRLVWNTGDFAGHKSAIVRVPARGLSISILSNGTATEPEDIALRIIDHILPPAPGAH